jgi:hypothetical protein
VLEIFDLPGVVRWLATSWLGRALSLVFAVAVAGALALGWRWDPAIAAAIAAWIAGTLGASWREGGNRPAG